MIESRGLPTKERIIDAAGDIFGRQGFKAATIRSIARAAHVNIAAINYHFAGKKGLYRAVLEDIFSKEFQKFPSTLDAQKNCSPDIRLQTFIHSMFHRFLTGEGWRGISGKGRLIAREFSSPTPAFEDILETYIKPQKEILVAIISDFSNGKAGMDKILACAISIIAQCVYYAFAAPMIQRMANECMPTTGNIDRLADHVFKFSLGGIQTILDPLEHQGPQTGHHHQEDPQ